MQGVAHRQVSGGAVNRVTAPGPPPRPDRQRPGESRGVASFGVVARGHSAHPTVGDQEAASRSQSTGKTRSLRPSLLFCPGGADCRALPTNVEVLVAEFSATARWSPRFSIRGLFFLILLVALALGWVSSQQSAERERRQQEQRLRYAEEELRRARDELRDQLRGPRPDRARSFWEADLEGSNLAGMTIASDGNAFQRASFRNCRLEGATLEGGVSSFQLARFDAAKLARASLKGGGASFQASSFVGADLTGATLIGGPLPFRARRSRGRS